MQKPIFLKIATPKKRNVQCVAFTAAASLLAAMLAAGITVRRHPVEPWQYVAPLKQIGEARFWELLQDSRFKYIAVVTFLVSPTGSNQTFSVPATWNNFDNKVEAIGGGASGGAVAGPTFSNCATGGGGGAYAAILNLALTRGGTATYQIAATAAGVGANSNGNAGNSCWFNGATFGASSVGAVGGGAGQFSVSIGSASGATGGAAASCIGTTKNSGGNSGGATASGQESASGAGGAGGPNGAGNNSTASTNASQTNGGSGDAGSGGSAGTANTSPGVGGPGGNGAEFDASHGCGGGGGAGRNDGDTSTATGGAGGNYGGGGGGASVGGNSTSATSGVGSQGLIVVTNLPATRAQLMSAVIG